MKKYLTIAVFLILVLIASSFRSQNPAPVPSNTSARITSIPGIYYSMKVVFTGYRYDDNTTTHQCEDIHAYPSGTVVFNADIKYWVDSGTWVTAHVYTKATSQSQWSFFGALQSCSGLVDTTVYDNFLAEMSFSYYDLPAPTPQ